MQALVTVALPVFNGGSLLELAVQSVVKQSWPDWELLIIDDGSTDGAIDGLSCLGDRRITLVRDGKNLGLAVRLNQAVSMARGKYFARMDHDDICHPERFSRQVRFLESHPQVDLLSTRCVTIDESNQLIGTLPFATDHADICRRPWQGFYMPHPTWMGRLDWFRRHAYLDPAPYCCEDQELLLRAHGASCYHTLADYLLAYRVRRHVPWRKVMRTHMTLAGTQIRYFVVRKQWPEPFLSLAAGLARVLVHGWRMLAAVRTRAVVPSASPAAQVCNYEEWQKVLTDLTGKVARQDVGGAE